MASNLAVQRPAHHRVEQSRRRSPIRSSRNGVGRLTVRPRLAVRHAVVQRSPLRALALAALTAALALTLLLHSIPDMEEGGPHELAQIGGER
jgi:hypothetical protein